MALFGLLDLALHVVKFENILLNRYGKYYVRFRIYRKCHSHILPAVPYVVKSKKDGKNPPIIDDINQSFYTREILVDSPHQIIKLNDICQFRIEIPATPSLLDRTNLFMECDLYYIYKDGKHQTKTYVLDSKLVALNGVASGYRHNFDLIFGDFDVCTVHLSIITTIIHYRITTSLNNIPIPSYSPGKTYKKWCHSIYDSKQEALIHWFSQSEMNKQSSHHTPINESKIETNYNIRLLTELFTNFLCLDIKQSKFAAHNLLSGNYANDSLIRDRNLLLEYNRNYYKCKDFTCFILDMILIDQENKKKCCTICQEDVKESDNRGFASSKYLYFAYILYSKLLSDALCMFGAFNNMSSKYLQIENCRIKYVSQESVYLFSDTNMFNNFTLDSSEDISYSMLQEEGICFGACETGQVVLLPLKINNNMLLIPNIDLIAFNNNYEALYVAIEKNLSSLSSLLFIEYNEYLDSQLNVTGFKEEGFNERFFINLGSSNMDMLDLEGLIQSMPVIDESHIYALCSYPLFRIHPVTAITNLDSTRVLDHEKNHTSIKNKAILYHLFVLVHGYNAGPYSMQIIRNMITVTFPNSNCLSSCFNQGPIDDNIYLLGQRLANEVKMYIKYCLPVNKISKITFIAHSLGGLVVRSALADLTDFSHLFHALICLASPHIGYTYNRSKLVDIFFWYSTKIKLSHCMNELHLSDSSEMDDTFLYRLSCLNGIEQFKYVIFLGSDLDTFSPRYSSLIDTGRIPISDIRQMEMACNILDKIKCLIRVDCNFTNRFRHHKGWVGRDSHLEFVESASLIRSVLYTIAGILNEKT